MKALTNMFAVVIVKPDCKDICSTWNDTHLAWQPAIFETEEGAGNFLENISKIKGHELFEYSIIQVGIVQ